jgi:hypothetical protein
MLLNEAERAFLLHRAPLYWRWAPVDGGDPEATGWKVLRHLLFTQPAAIARRFQWKTPMARSAAGTLPGKAVQLVLVRKLMKELEEPWSSLFAMRRPDRQIRLRA